MFTRVDTLGPVEKVFLRRISSTTPLARAATRMHAGQERHRNESADLVEKGSIIAIARGQRQELNFVLVVKSRGEMSDPDCLQGKVLSKVDGTPNRYTSTGAKTLSFHAALVRSPPLVFEKTAATVSGKKLIIFKIDDNEFRSLIAEFLF